MAAGPLRKELFFAASPAYGIHKCNAKLTSFSESSLSCNIEIPLHIRSHKDPSFDKY